MGRQPDLTEKIWEDLRRFLRADDEDFADRYLDVRRRLLRIFRWRGATDPEELADETILRVAGKCGEIVDSYVGDPILYFSGFARRVFLESVRKSATSPPPPPEPPAEEQAEDHWKREAMDDCLDQCMTEKLAPDKRRLVLDYYRGETSAKIRQRKELAELLGKTTNALRIEVHRIRTVLQDCVFDCLKTRGFE